jgi:hypothetical protein
MAVAILGGFKCEHGSLTAAFIHLVGPALTSSKKHGRGIKNLQIFLLIGQHAVRSVA